MKRNILDEELNLFAFFLIVGIRIDKVAQYGSSLDPDPQHSLNVCLVLCT